MRIRGVYGQGVHFPAFRTILLDAGFRPCAREQQKTKYRGLSAPLRSDRDDVMISGAITVERKRACLNLNDVRYAITAVTVAYDEAESTNERLYPDGCERDGRPGSRVWPGA